MLSLHDGIPISHPSFWLQPHGFPSCLRITAGQAILQTEPNLQCQTRIKGNGRLHLTLT